jgi:hypothetical protein
LGRVIPNFFIRVWSVVRRSPRISAAPCLPLTQVVIRGGEQPFDVRGVRVFNPLHVEDIRETLTEPSNKEKA